MSNARDDPDVSDDERDEPDTNKPRRSSGAKSDFMRVGGNILSNVNYRIAIFLFFIGLFIFSDIFTEGFLSKISSDVMMGDCITTKGTILQLILLILSYIVLDLLCKYDLL